MKPEKPTEESTDAADLRRRAQARLQSQTPPPKVRGSTEELQRLVQELQVHQIELEMQNEALEESHARLEASAARYTDLYDFAPVSYFTLGLKGEIIQSNLAGARMLGLDRSRLLDHRFDAFVASADLPAFRTLLTRAFATQSPETIELRLAIKDKSPVAVLLQACVSEDGRESRLVLTDITEHKRAEHQLDERRKELQAFFGLAALGAKAGITLDEIYQDFVNLMPASWQYPEVTCARIIMGDSDFRTHNFKPSAWMQSVPVMVNGAVGGRIEVGYLEERPVEDDGPFFKEEKDMIQALATQIGILTERKQAEVVLRASEKKHRLLFENAGDMVFFISEEGQILDANPMAVKLLGYTRLELMSMTLQQIDSPEDRLHIADRTARLIQEGHLTFQTALQRKDGSLIPIDVNARRIVWDGKPAFLSICRDITERKQAEQENKRAQEALRAETVRRRSIFEQSPDGIVIISPQAEFLEFNAAAHREYGYSREEFARLNLSDLEARETAQETKVHIAECLRKGRLDFETLHRTREGDVKFIQVRAQVVDLESQQVFQCIFRNITEQKCATDALERSAHANRLLYRDLTALNACTDLDSALACLAQKIIDLGDMDCIGVYLINDQEAVLRYQIGLSSEFAEQVARLPLNMPHLKAILKNPEEIINLTTQFPEQAQEGVAQGLRHVYYIALCSEQQPFGFLSMATRSLEPPNAANLELIRILALKAKSLFLRLRIEDRLRSVQKAMAEGIVLQTADGVIIDCNPSAEKILGLSRDQILGRTSVNTDWQALHDDGRVFPGEEHPAMVSLRTGQSCRDVIMGLHLPDGSQRWININTEPMLRSGETRPYAVLTSFADITKRREIEQAVNVLLTEKTVLLKEVHHRVKNNLQLIISLLNLQSGQRQKGDMSDLLTSTRNRVRSMAMVHENLYRPENLVHLNLTNYLKHLCASLLQSAGPVSANVRIESQVENKSISIGQNQAVPFGLLINELVTNALKYAFPEERKGLIRVTVQSPASEKVLLTVADDGVGLPAGLDPRHAEGLGLKLVCLLAKQLHGTVNFDRGQGTAVQILFNTPAETETTHE